ncbi:MAG: hypothetical protein PHW69_03560 [Elusimicrobiaceae bacterium]|nr:hypothetical protein [Elusimicrobiaceae bacterium]
MKKTLLMLAVTAGLCGGAVFAGSPHEMDEDGPEIQGPGRQMPDDEDGIAGANPDMRFRPDMRDSGIAPRKGAIRKAMKPGKGEKGNRDRGLFPGKGTDDRMEDGKMCPELMQKMEGKFLAGVAELDKEFSAQLEALKDSDPGLYRRVSMRLGQSMFVSRRTGDESAARTGIEIAKAEVSKSELMNKYRTAKSDSDKKDIKSQLRTVLGNEFDLRQKFEEDRVKMVEKDLAELKKAVRARKNSRSDMVNDKLDEILGEKPRW